MGALGNDVKLLWIVTLCCQPVCLRVLSPHDRPEPFMGRGSSSVTIPPWSYKITLWTLALSLLLLLSAMNTAGSPTPRMGGQPDSDTDPGILATSEDPRTLATSEDPRSVDFVLEENIDISVKSAWSSAYDNVTLEGHSVEELQDNVLFRAERSPEDSRNNKKKKSGNREKGCSRQMLSVQVRDLGLGYDSDEWVTFYYCSGSCQPARSNYDITLTSLLKNKRIVHSAHGRVSNHPCCRPTGYLSVSFMDVKHKWNVLKELSAANCSCVR